jgi:hypothetical protein
MPTSAHLLSDKNTCWCTVWSFHPQLKKVLSVKPLYLLDITVAAESGVIQLPSKCHTDFINCWKFTLYHSMEQDFPDARVKYHTIKTIKSTYTRDAENAVPLHEHTLHTV